MFPRNLLLVLRCYYNRHFYGSRKITQMVKYVLFNNLYIHIPIYDPIFLHSCANISYLYFYINIPIYDPILLYSYCNTRLSYLYILIPIYDYHTSIVIFQYMMSYCYIHITIYDPIFLYSYSKIFLSFVNIPICDPILLYSYYYIWPHISAFLFQYMTLIFLY